MDDECSSIMAWSISVSTNATCARALANSFQNRVAYTFKTQDKKVTHVCNVININISIECRTV